MALSNILHRRGLVLLYRLGEPGPVRDFSSGWFPSQKKDNGVEVGMKDQAQPMLAFSITV